MGRRNDHMTGDSSLTRTLPTHAEAALTVKCKICMQTFLQTVREPALKEHAENKHSKTVKDCFPDWTPAAK